MRYHIIEHIENGTYDLLTEEEFEEKDDDFWDIWNCLAFEVELDRLRLACKKRKLSLKGTITPFPSGSGFDNFYYDV